MASNPKAAKTSHDQTNLSGQLMLLRLLGYHDDTTQFSNKLDRNSDGDDEFHFVEYITLALCTGEKGDVFAAVLDPDAHKDSSAKDRGKPQSKPVVKVLLATNNFPTPADKKEATSLFRLLCNPESTGVKDLWDYLTRRCGQNMKRRVERLQKCTQDEDLNCIPNVGVLGPTETQTKWRARVQKLCQLTGDFLRLNMSDRSELTRDLSFEMYRQISEQANSMMGPDFQQWFYSDARSVTISWSADRFRRRVRKVSQYFQGMDMLVRKAKDMRWGNETHTWVDIASGSSEYPVISHYDSDVVIAAGHSLPSTESQGGKSTPATSDDVEKLLEENKFFSRDGWKESVRSVIHAEIRLILALYNPNDYVNTFNPVSYHTKQNPPSLECLGREKTR